MPEKGLRIHSTSHLIQPGLLAVADPARVGADLDRRVRRPALPPVGGDLELRGVHGLDEAQRAAAARRDRRPARGRARLPARPGLLVRVHAGSSRPTAGRWSARREGSSTRCTRRGRTSSRFSNTFSCELIERELDGEDVTELVEFYNDFYLYAVQHDRAPVPRQLPAVRQPAGDGREVRLRLARRTSRGIGNAWCHERMRKPEDIKRLGRDAAARDRDAARGCRSCSATGTRSSNTPFEGVSVLPKQLAPYIQAQADMAHAGRGRRGVRELGARTSSTSRRSRSGSSTGPPGTSPSRRTRTGAINPLAISLHPERWEADGLYSDDGISLAQAREMLPGIEEMDLEARGAVVAA